MTDYNLILMKECYGEFFRLNLPQVILQGWRFSLRMEMSGGNLTVGGTFRWMKFPLNNFP